MAFMVMVLRSHQQFSRGRLFLVLKVCVVTSRFCVLTRWCYSESVCFTCVVSFPGHDVIAQAQSGTGKTATFSVSILQKIDINLRECQALVLAPTRELAQQVRVERVS